MRLGEIGDALAAGEPETGLEPGPAVHGRGVLAGDVGEAQPLPRAEVHLAQIRVRLRLQREPGDGGAGGRDAPLQRAGKAGPGLLPRPARRPDPAPGADPPARGPRPSSRRTSPRSAPLPARAGSGSAAVPSLPPPARKKNPRTCVLQARGCRIPSSVQAATPPPHGGSTPTASRAGLLAPGSFYSPRLPIPARDSGSLGFRPRLQRRVRDGFAPSSLSWPLGHSRVSPGVLASGFRLSRVESGSAGNHPGPGATDPREGANSRYRGAVIAGPRREALVDHVLEDGSRREPCRSVPADAQGESQPRRGGRSCQGAGR